MNYNLLFPALERAYATKSVPQEWKAEILLNIMGEKADNVLPFLDGADLDDNDKLKSLILQQFQLTPQECVLNFRKSKRLAGESHTNFAARLTANLQHYLRLRKVEIFQQLLDLFVFDQLIETLDSEASAYITCKLGKIWKDSKTVARLLDIFFASRNRSLHTLYP